MALRVVPSWVPLLVGHGSGPRCRRAWRAFPEKTSLATFGWVPIWTSFVPQLTQSAVSEIRMKRADLIEGHIKTVLAMGVVCVRVCEFTCARACGSSAGGQHRPCPDLCL